MTLNDYRDQFRKNMMCMSQTMVDNPNMNDAVEFLFNNRNLNLESADDLENLILETARIAGISYTKIKDIPDMWHWFVNTFFWMLTSQCFEPEETAAFSEYIINIIGHFFSDCCGEISMLISSFVFMRFNLSCPKYISRDEYCRVTTRSLIPSVKDMRSFLADPDFENFLSYYLSLCPGRESDFYSYFEIQDDGSYICYLAGYLSNDKSGYFRMVLESFYEKHGDIQTIFDCGSLLGIDEEGIRVLKDMRSSGKSFILKNLSIDCRVLLKSVGLESAFNKNSRLKKINLSNCPVISEGANGIIYRVSDEVVAKAFKSEPNYYDIVRERISLRNALITGIPAPISLGYAEYDGRIVTLMELIDAKTLLKIISTENDFEEYIIRYAQFVRRLHKIQDRDKLKNFRRNMFGTYILSKTDITDSILPVKYRGKARSILSSINEPDCLIHGDIQPNNIMVSGDEMMFIDFDSFSTGKAVYDLGSLYRTLFDYKADGIPGYNGFLKLPVDRCSKIWDIFVGEYYREESEQVRQQRIVVARMIGIILCLAKHIKKKTGSEIISEEAEELKRCFDEAVG